MSTTQPAVRYASTLDGRVLPIIDVTHPHFEVPSDPEAMRRIEAEFARDERQRRWIPEFVMRLMLQSAARQSELFRALFQSKTGYLDSISTYLMKLGPDDLPASNNGPMDRRLASSPHVVLLRLRMQQTAGLLADGIGPELAASPGVPLNLINIAGGPAMDSLNALIMMRQRGLLARPIGIHVLDSDQAGPGFGANIVAALREPGAPLDGLDISFKAHPYDWREPAPLGRLLAKLAQSVIAASSEGGLFEYGSDEAIVSNLQTLRAGEVKVVTGSVTRDDESRRRMIAATGMKLIPRGLGGFAPLAERGGFTIVRSVTALLSDQVLMTPDSNS
jgi:hypothetical protein